MEEFWKRVDKTDYCWNWVGSKRRGYGRFMFRDKIIGTHRISYIIHKGEIPKGMLICHKCDNPSCVNPDHLFLGTHKDNAHDCVIKGRKWLNHNNTISKNNMLTRASIKTLAEVEAVKYAIKNRGTKTLKQISIEFRIGRDVIIDINNGRCYGENSLVMKFLREEANKPNLE